MRIIYINYGNKAFKTAQRINTLSARYLGKANKIINYSPADLDKKFIEKNIHILKQHRGNGYWLWKPYIVWKTLISIQENDFLIYCDSGSIILRNFRYLINVMIRDKVNILAFEIQQDARKWTKKDAYILMECEEQLKYKYNQICATFFIVKKTPKTMELLKQFLKYAQNENILTDNNIHNNSNSELFIEHRHDQAIFNLLLRKNKIKPYRDPSQFGMNFEDIWEQAEKSTYPQMIYLHRYGSLKGCLKSILKKFLHLV